MSKNITTFTAQGLSSLLGLITFVLLARFLGVDEFGKFSLVFIIMLLCLDLMRSFTIHPMQSNHHKFGQTQYFTTGLAIACVMMLVIAVIVKSITLISANYLTSWGIGDGFLASITYISGKLFCEYLKGYFYSYSQPKRVLAIDATLFVTVIGILVFLRPNQYGKALYIIAAAHYLVIIGNLLFIRYSFKDMGVIAKFNLNQGKWLCGTGLLKWLNGNFIILVATSVLGVAVAGGIRAMQTILSPIGVVYLALDNIVPVKAATLYKKGGRAKLNKYLGNLVLAITGLVFLSVCVAWLLGGFINQLLYSGQYAEYIKLLPFIGTALILAACTNFAVYGLRTIGQTKPIFNAYLINAIISVIFAYPLVKYFGIIGFGIGIIGFQLLLSIYCYYRFSKIK